MFSVGTQEADAVVSVLGEMDAWIICPFFLQGGRYTVEDIHYVADSDTYVLPFIIQFLEIGLYKVIGLLTYFFPFYRLVPSGDTEFAKDASFGYKSSNLREVCFCFFFFS